VPLSALSTSCSLLFFAGSKGFVGIEKALNNGGQETKMSDISMKPTVGSSGLRHTPPKIKTTEQAVAYNPFFMDLSIEKPKLDPKWATQPCIILNWLLRESQSSSGRAANPSAGNRLILGVEANSADNMKAFLDKFCPGHGLAIDQIKGLVMLGHATLACKIRTNQVVTSFDSDQDKEAFAGNLDNYSGVLGGELHYGWKGFHRNCWYINYNSGRYGPQHLKKADAKGMKSLVKLLFKKYCGVTVYD
jgi:hypothetical protein